MCVGLFAWDFSAAGRQLSLADRLHTRQSSRPAALRVGPLFANLLFMMTELKRWTNPRLALGIGFLSLVAAVSVYGLCAHGGDGRDGREFANDGGGLTRASWCCDNRRVPVPPAVTINHVMVAQIDHASHQLWGCRPGGASARD